MIKISNKEDLIANTYSSRNRRAREIALNAIEKAFNTADPRSLIRSKVNLSEDTLRINGKDFNLSVFQRIFVVGGGKASGSMAEALEEILGDRIEDGLIVVPKGTAKLYKTERIRFHEGSHPIPDESSVEGARRILEIAERAEEDDLVICLISGGGSSLMCMPRPEISLEDKKKITELLLKSGANIHEINAVRKHISSFKGGMLARKAYPATLISLILSDVIGDNLDVIASGPTVPDSSTFKDAIEILRRYGIWDEAPSSIRRVLSDGGVGRIGETPKPGDPIFSRVFNFILGNNRLASLAAVHELKRMGMNTLFLTSLLEGEARDVGLMLSTIALEINLSGNPVEKPAAIVLGGETTVTVKGDGIGGRNQEIVLSSALRIRGVEGVVVASASTDGIDGPTDAAGAIADGDTLKRAEELGLNALEYLENNDSYTFFSKTGDLIFTGPTGTNVNDISVIVVL